jgi:hypothetical protein
MKSLSSEERKVSAKRCSQFAAAATSIAYTPSVPYDVRLSRRVQFSRRSEQMPLPPHSIDVPESMSFDLQPQLNRTF